MKVLSVKEPFATLIALGLKWYETRTWPNNYEGEVLLHASKGIHRGEAYVPITENGVIPLDYQEDFDQEFWFENLPCKEVIQKLKNSKVEIQPGFALGVMEIKKPTEVFSEKRILIDFEEIPYFEMGSCCKLYPKMWAWPIENFRKIEPFEMKGALGLRKVPEEIREKIKFIS